MAALQSVTDKTPSPLIRFATLQSDLPPEIIQKLAGRYRVPNEYADLAILVARFGSDYVNLNRMDETSLLNFLLKTDALRRQERFDQFIFTCDLISSTTSSQPKKLKKLLKRLNPWILNLYKKNS